MLMTPAVLSTDRQTSNRYHINNVKPFAERTRTRLFFRYSRSMLYVLKNSSILGYLFASLVRNSHTIDSIDSPSRASVVQRSRSILERKQIKHNFLQYTKISIFHKRICIHTRGIISSVFTGNFLLLLQEIFTL